MSARHDVIVVGSGLNGLVAAALLAGRGRKVLVLERRADPGGLAAAEEFHPGYRSGGVLHDTTGLRPSLVEELGLARHGLALAAHRPDLLALDDQADPWRLAGDPSRARADLAGLAPRDAERYAEYRGFVDRVRPVIADWLDEPPVDPTDLEATRPLDLLRRGLRLRRLGRSTMLELLRLPPMAVADWLGEWFEWEPLKAVLAYAAIAPTFAGPRSPGTAANLLIHEAAAGAGVEGGAHRLTRALLEAARSRGVDLRASTAVARILTGADGVRGVALATGEELETSIVVAACHPRLALVDLLEPGRLAPSLERHLVAFRGRGTAAQVLLALGGPVRFRGQGDSPLAHARTAGSLDRLERAFDAAKYRRISEEPVLDVHVPTVASPELAPAGHAVVSVLVHHVPYDLAGGWTDERREALGRRVVEVLDAHAPGLAASVVGAAVRTPLDLERDLGLCGGHLYHGEHALDQLMVRPAPTCVGYRTPVRGLFLCGGGSHPGGGLTGAPGRLAARAVLAG